MKYILSGIHSDDTVVNYGTFDSEDEANMHAQILSRESSDVVFKVTPDGVVDTSHKKYIVWGYSSQCKLYVSIYDTNEDAKSFCEDHNYEFIDNNSFVWDLEIEEVKDSRVDLILNREGVLHEW